MADHASYSPGRPIPAPAEYAGQWIAWDRSQTQVIAHGRDVAAVRAAAVEAGHPDAILQKLRRQNLSFIGSARDFPTGQS